MTNVSYITSLSSTSFYKISIVNKSTFYGNALLLSQFLGPMFYVSGSNFVLYNESSISYCRNDDKSNPHMSFDTSIIDITDSTFSQLYSDIYSPIISLSTNTFYSENLVIY